MPLSGNSFCKSYKRFGERFASLCMCVWVWRRASHIGVERVPQTLYCSTKEKRKNINENWKCRPAPNTVPRIYFVFIKNDEKIGAYTILTQMSKPCIRKYINMQNITDTFFCQRRKLAEVRAERACVCVCVLCCALLCMWTRSHAPGAATKCVHSC